MHKPDDVSAKEKAPLISVSFQRDSIRFSILASYWIVFLLAIPLWWSTTSIERLSLPRARVHSQSQATEKLRFPIDVLLTTGSRISHPAKLGRDVNEHIANLARRDQRSWQSLDVHVATDKDGVRREQYYEVVLSEDSSSNSIGGRTLHLRTDVSRLSELPAYLADTLRRLLIPFERHEQRTVQYAPQYRLAFTLLNEDASVGGGLEGWDVEAAVRGHLSRTLAQLNVLHNFTVESQVQFHAPLAFEPPRVEEEGNVYFILGEEQLKIFVNSAEWTLASSISNDPVLHFILFIPSLNRRPLRIVDTNDKPSLTNAFIVPQWGGIVISDPSTLSVEAIVDSAFSIFRTQLLALLGVPRLPPGFVSTSHELTGWQLDALLRRRAHENVRDSIETMNSIVKLVDQIENMPVGEDVRGDVIGALSAIDTSLSSANHSTEDALGYSSRALVLASRAFFNPGMVGLLYFPAEHKYAVYTPLFAPVTVPLVVALLREIKAWKARRKAVKDKSE